MNKHLNLLFAAIGNIIRNKDQSLVAIQEILMRELFKEETVL